ncbi:MAG: DUF1499 domain-containing protein [bacterium]|nr:DUF1499 domain-containing protein [bacterium]
MIMTEPTDLGERQGRLAPCPSSPNCVSSFAEDEEHRVEPLAFSGDPAAVIARLREIIEAMPRARVVDASENYLRSEHTSLVFRYVDDLEILVDPEAGKIHVRSASRTGYSDLGVNRKRVAALAEAWVASAG